MSKDDNDAGTADTAPELHTVRHRDRFPSEEHTTGELARGMKYQERDIERHEKILVGDGKGDLGLRGDVHQIRTDLAEHREQYKRDMAGVHAELKARGLPRWAAVLAALAVTVAGFSIAYRAIAQELRTAAASGFEIESRAQAQP